MSLDLILAYILLSTTIISLIAFIGVFSLSINDAMLRKILLALVSLSAGALMGGAFIHLLPESVESIGAEMLIFTLVGFVLFFIVEKILMWRHCHNGKCDVHTFRYMNLIGDAIHNLIDGLILAASFFVSTSLGISATIAIAFHEIPQELGDFGVLVYGGYKKRKALLLNFAVALTAVCGGVIGYFASVHAGQFAEYLLPFAAGGFIYIAATDLVPEIKKELDVRKSTTTLLVFVGGIFLMWLVKVLFGG